MKKSKKMLLIFICILLLTILINSFVYNFLYGMRVPIFLGLVLIVFKYIFGFEKSKFRVTKDVVMDTVVFVIIYLLLFYLLGLITGFIRIGNYYTFNAMRDYVIPLILTSIFREIMRYNYLIKSNNDKLLISLSMVFFILLDISSSLYYWDFSNGLQVFKFFALYLLPAFSYNMFATYVCKNAGYKSPMIYSLIIGLFNYLIPIIPDASEYLVSITKILLPLIILYRIYITIKNESDEEISRDYNKKDYISLVVAFIIVATLVYFSSGYFTYYTIAIASGSMSPAIEKGDIVVVKKTNDYESINNGDVIVYDYHDHLIVHRLVKKVKVEGKYYFYSKGDANKDEDNYVIEEDMIIGTAKTRIPYLGLPTVWLNELREE